MFYCYVSVRHLHRSRTSFFTLQINTDETKVTYGAGPTGEFQVMSPIKSVLYTVNGTTTTVVGTDKTVNIMKTSDIADEVLTLVNDDYFAV